MTGQIRYQFEDKGGLISEDNFIQSHSQKNERNYRPKLSNNIQSKRNVWKKDCFIFFHFVEDEKSSFWD
mgnify:CR=1 FL=1